MLLPVLENRIYKITHYNVARNGERECISKECWRQQEKSNPEMEVIWIREQSLSIERCIFNVKLNRQSAADSIII